MVSVLRRLLEIGDSERRLCSCTFPLTCRHRTNRELFAAVPDIFFCGIQIFCMIEKVIYHLAYRIGHCICLCVHASNVEWPELACWAKHVWRSVSTAIETSCEDTLLAATQCACVNMTSALLANGKHNLRALSAFRRQRSLFGITLGNISVILSLCM